MELKALFRTRAVMSFMLALVCVLGPTLTALADNNGTLPKASSTSGDAEAASHAANTAKNLIPTYTEVLEGWKKNGAKEDHTGSMTLSAASLSGKSANANVAVESYDGKNNVLVWKAKGEEWVEYDLDVAQGGLYSIEMSYHPFVDSRDRKPIALSLSVDGVSPYLESKSIELYRHWKDKMPIVKDDNGDEIRPAANDISSWQTWELRDMSGAYLDPLLWNLTPGKHKIRLAGSDPMALEFISFKAPVPVADYAAVKKEQTKNAAPVEADPIVIEAEQVGWKNDSSITLAYDNDIANSPYVRGKISYNTLDGSHWSSKNQEISWSFDAPAAGFYKIALRQQQSLVSNRSSFRTIMINGKVPFSELKAYRFPYATGWKGRELANDEGEPYQFYLEKGTNTISMRVTQAPLIPAAAEMDKGIATLVKLSTDLRTLTGGVDDKNRTWDLKKDLPGFVEQLQELNDNLAATREQLIAINGRSDALSQGLVTVSKDIETLLKYPDEIPYDAGRMNTMQGKLADLVKQLSSQPLQIDRIFIVPVQKPFPKMESTFAEKIQGSIINFFNTFRSKEVSEKTDDQVLNVWMNRGRDYVNLLQSMANEMFTPQTGIKVKINLLKDDKLLLLMNAAGMAPDVGIGLPHDTPFDYAIRNGVYNLKQFPDFDDVYKQFAPGAWMPYFYDGGYYAVPETQTFSMMFYRKDILQNLGLSVPDTWDDMYRMLPVLQQNGMNFTPVEHSIFMQMHGLEYIKQDGSRTGFNNDKGFEAFKEWTDLQNKYGIDQRSDNFVQHFRDGSYPIGIADLNGYLQLTVAAPELNGVWGVAPIPGVKQADGTVVRWTGGNGGDQFASAIFKHTKKPQESWEFLKWWMSEEVQEKYGLDLETLNGVTFRWYTSNVDSFVKLPWKEEDLQAILEQWKWFREVAKVPGSYYMERELTNAWTRTVINGENYRTSLETAIKEVDREIQRKMQEFHFVDANGQLVRSLNLPVITKPWEGVDKYVKK
ncbi:extracellular solute-binding protein [Paenibacillus chondroitinus]|uniref:Extracellular solute-binding protein n=1 Tax=Paenibacillus chondroitinus TaxID=59842 RepID=A0ABU6DA93_9BACL|nr:MULTISPECIES: extracellular solute-binding protein [Paenibacillus]MCY9656696.1 extracellular solute-binding protein [Paenibacillus anseongense]MEB4794345.1 extracellular solute-binding protein [Paenibacillus chondroitinus]